MDENERDRPSLRPLTESEKRGSSTGWVVLLPLLFVPVVVLNVATAAIESVPLRYAVMGLCIVALLALVIVITARWSSDGAKLPPRDVPQQPAGDDEGSQADGR